MDKDVVADFDNLYKAYRKAKSGKGFNTSTAKFSTMALDGIYLIKEQLENQSYKEDNLNRFKIYEPKERVIESCSFKDKVVQHCFCDNILDAYGIPAKIEINHADDFVNMIVSARQVKCEFKYEDDK